MNPYRSVGRDISPRHRSTFRTSECLGPSRDGIPKPKSFFNNTIEIREIFGILAVKNGGALCGGMNFLVESLLNLRVKGKFTEDAGNGGGCCI